MNMVTGRDKYIPGCKDTHKKKKPIYTLLNGIIYNGANDPIGKFGHNGSPGNGERAVIIQKQIISYLPLTEDKAPNIQIE
jgi:hypothetical protein